MILEWVLLLTGFNFYYINYLLLTNRYSRIEVLLYIVHLLQSVKYWNLFLEAAQVTKLFDMLTYNDDF